MLKGINQWCYPDQTPIETVFEYSRDASFEAVELNLNEAGGIGLTVETTKEEALKIKALAEKYRIELRSLSTSLLWKMPLCSPDEQIRQQGIQVVKKMLEMASYIGMDTILLVPGAVSDQVSYEKCYKRSQDSIRELIPKAEKYGVKMGIENVWNKFLLSPLEMARYIDEFESDYVGAYFDVGNVLQFGYPEQWIRLLGKRILKVHVKDFNISVGNGAGFVPLLAGDVNWKAVIEALREIGYEDTLTAELSPYSLCPHTLADDTARHLDVILKKMRSA
ncbi:sugar phosphate isomerase/epimerase [Lederbergia sp. NSJ-179]|uniref:sugar phosphate isomerase/epimerase family protein n=1 Tax=Lederbergia sp. NSJ-179 TaxID=2931402 RepID=UPI001FD5DADC|nr:sugar phosphate isomerase/epimerase family protein [Lederbergia sp. NSJ-179]MCJ7841272.1 sugar phosphate isomerase/epimerase [Lederbergia sp. NSJ-179]